MQGSHSCRVDVDFQCSSQLGPGCSKANLVSEVLKQRTGKAILCRQIWFIFLKIQLTHPLLPWQMPPWYEEISSCFLLYVIAFLIKLTGVIKKKKFSEQLLKVGETVVDRPAGWPTLVTSPSCQADLSSPPPFSSFFGAFAHYALWAR